MKTTHTTKNSLRLVALALTVAASASAQITPGFEATITQAVHVSWPTTTNRAYQVIASTNNMPGTWTLTGQLVEGTGGRVGSFFPATNGQRYFRVFETTASGLAWLHGTWSGMACQTGPGLPLLSLQVGVVADATNRVFTATIGSEPCHTTLRLLTYTDTQAQFYSSVQSGNCVDAAFTLTRINATNIAYHFITTNSPGTGGGLLIKQ